MKLHDTIVAVATPPGRSGIGVVRLSGPTVRKIGSALLRFAPGHEWEPRRATVADLIDENGAAVDQVVATWFAAPRSYTAEDLLEISCHGAPVVLRFCVERACSAGARLAEPGEFTLRAFLNGRIDLPQSEAVRDLIEATTLYQARIAARQIEGSVSRRIRPSKDQLLELIALLEAGIDFAEDDISVATPDQILARLDPIEKELARLAATFSFGKLVHGGIRLAIVGRPNVGKSSLFNRLLEQDRAIVTPVPGTTRDVISETTALNGIPVTLVDTAGIREGQDFIESLGIERSYQAMADADITLAVVDLSSPLTPEDYKLVERVRAQGRYLIVGNKADLPRRAEMAHEIHPVSALTGSGIDDLRRMVSPAAGDPQESGFITSMRHESLLRESLEALAHARQAVESRIPHEMLLLDLYAALRPIDAITGATTADDILNRIFSTFCIGK